MSDKLKALRELASRFPVPADGLGGQPVRLTHVVPRTESDDAPKNAAAGEPGAGAGEPRRSPDQAA